MQVGRVEGRRIPVGAVTCLQNLFLLHIYGILTCPRTCQQILAAVSAAVDHHLPELKSVTRSKVENALQRQLRSAIAPSLDPGSGTCAHKDYNLAIVNAFHSIGRVCALCCSTWWSHSGALPEKPRLIQPSNSWNAHFYSDYASAYINWDHDALGYRSSEGTDLCDVRHKLDAALSQIKALCKIVDSFFPSAAAATGSGMLVEDFFSSGPSPPAPAAEGPDISLHLARAAAFRPPRGLALVTTMAMCLTVLHRESLWVHARLFPVFFHVSSAYCVHNGPGPECIACAYRYCDFCADGSHAHFATTTEPAAFAVGCLTGTSFK